MRGAQELANDLHHALELAGNERDEAIRERDEAQSVIDAVRKVRDALDESGRSWAGKSDVVSLAYGSAVALLDEVDGL